jgi:hypothetical protein
MAMRRLPGVTLTAAAALFCMTGSAGASTIIYDTGDSPLTASRHHRRDAVEHQSGRLRFWNAHYAGLRPRVLGQLSGRSRLT